MLRKEILERIREFQEQFHVLAGTLATLYVLTFAIEFWRAHGTESQDEFLEIFHWILVSADAVGSALFIGILLFRAFGFAKPTRQLSRAIEDQLLLKKVHEWLLTELGDASPRSVRFCSAEEIEHLVRLNHEAFKDSAFEVEIEKLTRRNTAWIKKNPRIFMMILDPLNREQYVGYSAMVPLTREGLDCYLEGRIKDADLPVPFIASNKATTAGVIIFAIYLRSEFRFQRSQASRNYSIYFLACVRRHLAVLFPKPRKMIAATPYPPIYVQTEWSGMKRRLKRSGFIDTGKVSAEGFDFLVYEHPFASPALLAGPTVMEEEADWE